jgi:glycosyltransferase involved in cell wall biosynthesis
LLLFVGRLVEEKGVGDLLAAVAMLRRELPDVSALVVGEGQDRARFEAMASELGLSDRVTFAGWVEPDRLPAFFAAADAFVGPSRTGADGWVEAQGLTFLEAMMAGTPVVATRSGGIVDAVRHEETGLLVDEGRPDQIASAVRRVQGEPGLRRRIVDGAARMVSENFSRGRSAERFSDLFSSLLRAARRESGVQAG